MTESITVLESRVWFPTAAYFCYQWFFPLPTLLETALICQDYLVGKRLKRRSRVQNLKSLPNDDMNSRLRNFITYLSTKRTLDWERIPKYLISLTLWGIFLEKDWYFYPKHLPILTNSQVITYCSMFMFLLDIQEITSEWYRVSDQ